MPLAQPLVEEGMFNILFVASLFSAAAPRTAMNEIHQTDFLFLTPVTVSAAAAFHLVSIASWLWELPLGIGVILANGARPLSISR